MLADGKMMFLQLIVACFAAKGLHSAHTAPDEACKVLNNILDELGIDDLKNVAHAKREKLLRYVIATCQAILDGPTLRSDRN